MAEHGTLAITARGDGNRWYGRITIPEQVAREANIHPGTRVAARCCEGLIIIQADDQGRIRFPPARGKSSPRHAFEAATATLGLRDIALTQTPSPTEVSEGTIRIRVPDEFLASDMKLRRKPRKEIIRPDPAAQVTQGAAIRYGGNGAAAAIMTEASRVGKVVRPLSLSDAIDIIRNSGDTLDRLGERMFKLNGVSVNIGDISERVAKLEGSTEQCRVVIVLD